LGCAAALALAALAAGGAPARASTFDTYGFSARAIAMGNALVASGLHYDAVYYNPANLLLRKRTHFGMGLRLVAPSLDVTPAGGDFARLEPSTSSGFYFAMATPLSGVFDDKVGFGLALYHPLTSGTRVESIDPKTPYFYRYQNLPDKLVFAASLAVEPVEWLRVGVGAQVLAAFDGDVIASLSLAEGRFTREEIDLSVRPAVSSMLGLSVGPLEGLRLGVAYRHALELDYELPVRVTIEGVGDLDVLVRGTSLYTPNQLAVGVSWESAPAPEVGVTIEAGITWEEWHLAPPAGALFLLTIDDSQVRPPTDPQDAPEAIIDVSAAPIPLGARDTVTPRVGAEWRIDDTWTVRAGWFWRPTPLPRPIYQGNTLDASAHVVSLGGSVAFGDPLGVTSNPLLLDLTAQLTRLSTRAVEKAPGFEPEGAYTFGGTIWQVMIDLRHDYL
ncbi:MAG: outer membrane protein transport protein, partial [Myxococcales bacterium]|nr:outer membrane protein transport protein [Myxococcales bacterium]